ncbi:uncharacterized protein [Palaemon carinicauda]|uniref:uncharacterized protein n=1 Tax=Palaemon carinicauda TaxID=392227 RepID=UPI0035B5A556
MNFGDIILKLLQIFGFFPFSWRRNLNTFSVNKFCLGWCVLNNLIFIAAVICLHCSQAIDSYLHIEGDHYITIWNLIFLIIGLSRLLSLAKSYKLARVLRRVRKMRSKRGTWLDCKKSDILVAISLSLLVYGNIWILNVISNQLHKNYREEKKWWPFVPRIYILAVCLLSHLLVPYSFCFLVRSLTAILCSIVPAGSEKNCQCLYIGLDSKNVNEMEDPSQLIDIKDTQTERLKLTGNSEVKHNNNGRDDCKNPETDSLQNLEKNDNHCSPVAEQENFGQSFHDQHSSCEEHSWSRETGKKSPLIARDASKKEDTCPISEEQLLKAEALLLLVDQTTRELMDYIGPYLLHMLIALIMALSVFLYSLVKSFVEHRSLNWHYILIFTGCGFSFFHVNNTADEFNDERERCAMHYRKTLHLNSRFHTNPTIYRILWILDRKVDFTLAGFVSLGRSHVATTVSLIISYVVIALQFRGSNVFEEGDKHL